ncbi:MAG: TIGR03013 family PEP-CTERM/XrtA system glycosyltransferase [Methylococcales bacterium]|nr:MAG: TIGR03013 family PEP-CTERM/XrtA system glycosyltransferase [Methylococcales bacterium]
MIRIFRHYISRAYLLLLSIEFFMFFAAMYWGSDIRFLMSESWYTDNHITLASFIFSSVMSLSCIGLGLYRRTLSGEEYNLLTRVCISFGLGILLLVGIYYLLPELYIARSVLVFAIMLAFLGLSFIRYLFYKFTNLERLKRRFLVVGSGQRAQELISLNDTLVHKGFTMVGFLALKNEVSVVDTNHIITYDRPLIKIAAHYKVDEIVIAIHDRRLGLPFDELLECKMSGITIMNIVEFYEREQGIISLANVSPSWLIFCDGFAQGDLRGLKKRVVDLFASVLLLSVAWPIMCLTALAISLESGFKGPILYRQVRVGEKNRHFKVLKFRSMKTDAEKNGAQWAQKNDDRITCVGRFIRASRIDELPQILNVLKGDMSFVGPRPERPEFVEGFNERIPYYQERHRVKPGITGWAQLCYPYGANEYDTIQKLQYDLYYVKNYSMFLDFSILFNTVEVILWGRGAR